MFLVSSGTSFFPGCYGPIGIPLMILQGKSRHSYYLATIADRQQKQPILNLLTFILWILTITGKSYKYKLLVLGS